MVQEETGSCYGASRQVRVMVQVDIIIQIETKFMSNSDKIETKFM